MEERLVRKEEVQEEMEEEEEEDQEVEVEIEEGLDLNVEGKENEWDEVDENDYTQLIDHQRFKTISDTSLS